MKSPRKRTTINNAFIKNNFTPSIDKNKFSRQESEENRLIDEEDEQEEAEESKKNRNRSNISGLSDSICKDPHCNHAKCGKAPMKGKLNLVVESVSSEEENNGKSEASGNDVFEVFEDGKEFENYKKSKSSAQGSQSNSRSNNSFDMNKPNKSNDFRDNKKLLNLNNSDLKNNEYELENLELLE